MKYSYLVTGMTDEPCAFEMKLSRYIQLGAADQEGIERLKADPKRLKRNAELIEEGRPSSKVLLIHEGWARSYKLLQNGTRTIVSFPIAGDFIGIRSTLLARADDSTAAVTDLVVSELGQEDLRQIFESPPRLFSAILWAVSRDEAMVVEHLVGVSRRGALERTAHFVLELADRLKLITTEPSDIFECPLSQHELADALGLSTIHVNRTLRLLRERGLVTFRKGIVTIEDRQALEEAAGYSAEVIAAPILMSKD